MFDFFKSKKSQNFKIAQSWQSKIDLRKQEVKVCLEKKKITTFARVAVVIDGSGSMKSLFNSGVVQETLERLLPIALNLDDNKELDVWIFSDYFKRLESITEQNVENYTQKFIIPELEYSGTNFKGVMSDIVNEYTKKHPVNYPNYVIFITDGENSDQFETTELITEASKFNIFWQFVGIGDNNFRFLKQLDTMPDRFVDNANFLEIKNLNLVSDQNLYDMLLTEFPSWITKAKNLKLITE